MSQMLMHIARVHNAHAQAFHEAFPDPHDSMQSFPKTRQPKEIIPTASSPSQPTPTHQKVQHSKATSFWDSDAALSFCLLHTHTRFMPFTKPPGSQKVRYRVEEKILLFNHTRRACMSDSPGREGYKERSGEVAVEDVVMFEEKGFADSSSESPDRPSSSHGSSSYRTNGKEMTRNMKRKRKGEGTKEMVGISVVRPKL